MPHHPRPDSVADDEITSYLSRASRPSSSSMEALSSLSAFQRRADRFPQLSADAQLELHARYVAGQQARQKLQAGGLKPRHAAAARAAVRAGDEALEYLVASNFRLVLLICREQAERRYGRDRAIGVLSDLVAEANLALTEAVTSFDASRGARFSTWAAHQVRSRVRASLSQEDTPIDVPSSWRRLKRIAAVRIPKLTGQLDRTPTTAEIQADLTEYCMQWAMDKLTVEQQALPYDQRLEAAAAKLRKQGMESAIRDVERILQLTAAASSLDTPVTDDGSRTLGDSLAVDHTEDAVDALDMDALKATIAQALAELTDREREIVLLRYGFEDGTMHTYGQICERFDVTAERIRQIEKKVLVKLRSSSSPLRDRLASFLPALDEVDIDERVAELSEARRRR